MTSFDPNNFISPSVLHPMTFFPDNIWISRPNFLYNLRKQADESKSKSNPYSISDINDSDFYSADEINTTGLLRDERPLQAKKPPLPPRRHAKAKKNNKQRKPHIQEEPDHTPTSSATERTPRRIAAIRSAIERLGDDKSYVKTSQGPTRHSLEEKRQTGVKHTDEGFEENEDSLAFEFTSLVRKASLGTKKVFRKLKASDLVRSPKKLWRRSGGEVRERVSSESLSTADPSSSYHLPQDTSPISERSARASSRIGDMDIPFSTGLAETRTGDDDSAPTEIGGSDGVFRKKTESALRYVQKWKKTSKIGGLIPRSRTRNVGEDTEGDESAWNSMSGEDSLKRRLARSLSF